MICSSIKGVFTISLCVAMIACLSLPNMFTALPTNYDGLVELALRKPYPLYASSSHSLSPSQKDNLISAFFDYLPPNLPTLSLITVSMDLSIR
ncbi:hypothetical protein [uncultured Megasphaera sp.]|uniref:hypothetical protein n=1 Tax=uncultured Megasphaera sp. TaxID=165188 RepID=UPI002598C99B|nr:hypothetical protein [uncultured Megasphaera sp.]